MLLKVQSVMWVVDLKLTISEKYIKTIFTIKMLQRTLMYTLQYFENRTRKCMMQDKFIKFKKKLVYIHF